MDNPTTFLDEETKQKISEMAESFAESEAAEASADPLHSRELLRIQIKDRFEKQIIQFYERVLGGLRELVSTIDELAEKDPEVKVDEVPELVAQLSQGIAKLSEDPQGEKTIKELSGLTDETIEKFNKAAAYLYETKQWDRASKVYSFLAFIEPRETAFFMGEGNAEFFSKRFENAVRSYEQVVLLDPDDPHCHFYLAHCYNELKDPNNAYREASEALEIIKHNPSLKEWLGQAEELKAYFHNMRNK